MMSKQCVFSPQSKKSLQDEEDTCLAVALSPRIIRLPGHWPRARARSEVMNASVLASVAPGEARVGSLWFPTKHLGWESRCSTAAI